MHAWITSLHETVIRFLLNRQLLTGDNVRRVKAVN